MYLRRLSLGLVLAALLAAGPAVYAQTEACCSPFGGCQQLPPHDCVALGGNPGGPGSSCTSGICEPRPCCLPDGTCAEYSAAYCQSIGGIPQPLGSTCDTATCPQTNECRPTPDLKECRQVDCPGEPDSRCRPKCLNINLETGEQKILACDCVSENECHPVHVTGTPFPQCAGDCPPGQVCNQTTTTNADGSVTVCCECVEEPTECRPNAEKTGCEQTACPDGRPCVPTRLSQGPNGQIIVEACGCRDPEDCQIKWEPGTTPSCSGACPDDGTVCERVITQGPLGPQFGCRCVCDPDKCDDGDPCTRDYCDANGNCAHDPVDCNDNDPCTIDSCKPNPNMPGGYECVHDPVNCDDGNPCTIDSCKPNSSMPNGYECVHDPVVCDDGDPCTDDRCDPNTGQCVAIANDLCEACCLPDGTCDEMPADECKERGGEPKGPGTDCSNVSCDEPETPKFNQPVSPEREDIASNLSLNPPFQVNKLVADDWRSDGRLITSVRWWGSYLNPEYMPAEFGGFGQTPYKIDGWLLHFLRPVKMSPNAPPHRALGVYFAPADKVRIAPEPNMAPCDGHPVFRYAVRLSDCCLIQSFPDTRVPVADPWYCPAQWDGFHERRCYRYQIGIQAVVGATWGPAAGAICCARQQTNNFAVNDFWGWHSTQYERGVRPAIRTTVSLGTAPVDTPCPPLAQCPPSLPWLFGPWFPATPVCHFPHRINMAFALMTDNPVVPPACPPFVLTHAVSIKQHGLAGEFGIDLPIGPVGNAGVECRRGGPTQVVLTFSEDIMAEDGSLDPGDEVTANVGTITGLSISGPKLTVELTGVPNQSCLELTVESTDEGITTMGSDPLMGDDNVHCRVLLADVNGDGQTASGDITQVKSVSGQATNLANFRRDVNTDGVIASGDITVVKGQSGKAVSCP